MKLPELKIGSLIAKIPIIQGGMSVRVSTSALAVPVAECGGIGTIGGSGIPVEELKEDIRKAKNSTKGIIAVNIMYAMRDFYELVMGSIEAGADMIITHHPMIFEGQKKINNHSFTGRRILKLIRNRIQYYAMHTNYDVLGMAELSADYLKLTDREVLSVTAHTEQGEEGFGRVGCLPYKMTLKECGEFVKEALALNDVRIYGDPDTMVEKAAICTGSGKSMISDVLAKGADVYVTGDIDHHTGIDAVASGLPIIDAGHYGTEYIFMKAMRKILEEKYPSLQITCAKMKSPYMIL